MTNKSENSAEYCALAIKKEISDNDDDADIFEVIKKRILKGRTVKRINSKDENNQKIHSCHVDKSILSKWLVKEEKDNNLKEDIEDCEQSDVKSEQLSHEDSEEVKYTNVLDMFEVGHDGVQTPNTDTYTEQNTKDAHVTKKKSASTSTKCDFCHKMIKGKHNFQKHLRTHTGEKPYRCNVCGKRFPRTDNLKTHLKYSHVKTVNGGPKCMDETNLFKCDVCPKSFRVIYHLNAHKRCHSGERPYECNVCQKRFAHSTNLHQHIRLHTELRMYECEMCDKSFLTVSKLKIHMRTHTGEKRYKCSLCGKAWKKKDSLNSHNAQNNNCRLANKKAKRGLVATKGACENGAL